MTIWFPILFINVILHLVFHFNKKQSEAEKAIVLLTSLINEATDTIENVRKKPSTFNDNLIDNIRYKYLTITGVIPSNTDKEYIEAKKEIKEKEDSKHDISKIN